MADLEKVIQLLGEVAYRKSETPFLLSSGEQSREYVNVKSVLLQGTVLYEICKWVSEIMGNYECHWVAGTGIGAIPIIGGVLNQGSTSRNQHYGLIVRDERKDHGTGSLIEGQLPPKGTKFVLVDDVFTTGKSILHTISLLEALGAEIVAVCVVVDRSNAEAFWSITNRGIDLHSITSISQLRYIHERETKGTNKERSMYSGKIAESFYPSRRVNRL